MKFKQVVVGAGEVGSAIYNVLKPHYEVVLRDVDGHENVPSIRVLHICFPYSKKFNEYVFKYQEIYNPDITIIHSTVPVGVSEQVKAVHSPIRGIHPHLEDGVRTFVKYFGGEDAEKAARYFRNIGIKTKTTKSSRTTEALKLWDTTQYGLSIVLQKEIYDWCKKNGVDFDIVYSDANKSYNNGYSELGRPEFTRYVLRNIDGPIGGHCVLPNAEILKSSSEIAQYIIRKNKSYGKKE